MLPSSCKISIHAPTRGATFVPKLLTSHQHEFQSTLPRGERRGGEQNENPCVDFNPRSHEGSDSVCPCIGNHRVYFNPRSHEGSDFCIFCNLTSPFLFQSTLPRGERLWFRYDQTAAGDFNPRSHEGSDCCQTALIQIIHISIHAPTRGATFLYHSIENDGSISIHAPTRGATLHLRIFLSVT